MRGDLGADVGAGAGFLGGKVETRRPVHAIAIEQGHRGHTRFRADNRQFLGQGSTFEEAEGRGGMELNVHFVIW